MSIFDSFEKKHDYLVCVDSDGCVMDTMNCKHFHCFGPCMVTEWGLEEWTDAILDRWNVINLFSMTRGINRFKGLAMALTEVNAKYRPIEGLASLCHWAETSPELSNDALQRAIEANPESLSLKKALAWSKAVNASIQALPESAGNVVFVVAGQHDGTYIQTQSPEHTDEPQYILIIGDAQVTADLVFLNVSSIDGNDHFRLVLQLQEHPQLAV
jgi:hypothetical protein